MRKLGLIVCLGLFPHLAGAETIPVDYQYRGSSTVSLSGMSGGPVTVGTFVDERADAEDPHTLTLGESTLRTEPALTELIRQAYAQGLESAEANTGDEARMTLHGALTELQVSRSDDGIELVMRCQTILRKGSRDAWQSSVYSRTTTDTESLDEALQAGLDKLVGELFGDNYFTMQLGIY